jgi:hypothetical protein
MRGINFLMRKNLPLVISIILALAAPGVGRAQSPDRAGLVLQYPDGRVETACVELGGGRFTGLDLLDRAGLAVNVDYSTGLGGTVCKIGETGCDAPGQPCFCQCLGTPCFYWNYWTLADGRWSYSPLGAGSRFLQDGDVDGWVWGQGKEPPEPMPFEEICNPEAVVETFASPVPVPRPTLVPSPSPSPSPSPTITSPASPLSPSPTTTLASQVFIPVTTGDSPGSTAEAELDLGAALERYAGLAGVVAALGLIALVVWRRQKGA